MNEVVCTLWPPSEPEPAPGTVAVLGPDESRHLVKARRVRAGEEVWASVGDGRGVRCRLIGDDRDGARLEALEVVAGWREPSLRVMLALGIIRPQHMETALTEGMALGMSRFVPLRTDHTEPHRIRPHRWDRLAAEAVKQCGRGWIPPVEEPTDLTGLLDRQGGWDALLVADAQASRDLPGLRRQGKIPVQGELLLVVGPEGDLSDGEREVLKGAGGCSFHLGARRLRSETAALAALALLLAG